MPTDVQPQGLVMDKPVTKFRPWLPFRPKSIARQVRHPHRKTKAETAGLCHNRTALRSSRGCVSELASPETGKTCEEGVFALRKDFWLLSPGESQNRMLLCIAPRSSAKAWTLRPRVLQGQYAPPGTLSMINCAPELQSKDLLRPLEQSCAQESFQKYLLESRDCSPFWSCYFTGSCCKDCRDEISIETRFPVSQEVARLVMVAASSLIPHEVNIDLAILISSELCDRGTKPARLCDAT